MLVEGLLLWSKVVAVNLSEDRHMKYYYLIGWGTMWFLLNVFFGGGGADRSTIFARIFIFGCLFLLLFMFHFTFITLIHSPLSFIFSSLFLQVFLY